MVNERCLHCSVETDLAERESDNIPVWVVFFLLLLFVFVLFAGDRWLVWKSPCQTRHSRNRKSALLRSLCAPQQLLQQNVVRFMEQAWGSPVLYISMSTPPTFTSPPPPISPPPTLPLPPPLKSHLEISDYKQTDNYLWYLKSTDSNGNWQCMIPVKSVDVKYVRSIQAKFTFRYKT